jgi:hypothetical protein
MNYEPVNRPPYFEEGIRAEVLRVWRRQGLSRGTQIERLFPSDPREEIELDLEPFPKNHRWPMTEDDLPMLRRVLNPDSPGRLPSSRSDVRRLPHDEQRVRMLRVHRGFFLCMGVYGWDRFKEVMRLLVEKPDLVRRCMTIWAEFSAALADRFLQDIEVDAAIFSEPIGGNEGPLMSPRMYEAVVLETYAPLMKVLARRGVDIVIFRTYANARILIPSILRWGFNCLWACEVNLDAMDYRSLRREFGRDLRLIGGIDLDTLRKGKKDIQRELMEKVPPLLRQGGYVPLADGRVRSDVPFENYVYYRRLLHKMIAGGG